MIRRWKISKLLRKQHILQAELELLRVADSQCGGFFYTDRLIDNTKKLADIEYTLKELNHEQTI